MQLAALAARRPPRPIGAEDVVAKRLRFERSKHGWTVEGLAQRMTDVGCPINPSSIWKIEKAERRRINLDEAYALARVLGISLDQLITPIGVVSEQEIARLLREAEDQANEFVDLFERMATTVNQLKVAAGEAVEAGESRWRPCHAEQSSTT